jgi:hypothetical protein
MEGCLQGNPVGRAAYTVRPLHRACPGGLLGDRGVAEEWELSAVSFPNQDCFPPPLRELGASNSGVGGFSQPRSLKQGPVCSLTAL